MYGLFFQTAIHRQMLIGCVLMFPMLIYVKIYAKDRDKALFYLGVNCSTSSVISYGAPLAAIVSVMSVYSQLSIIKEDEAHLL